MNVVDVVTGGTNQAGSADRIVEAIADLEGKNGKERQMARLKELAAADDEFDSSVFDDPDSLERVTIDMERKRILRLLKETLWIMPESPTTKPAQESVTAQ